MATNVILSRELKNTSAGFFFFFCSLFHPKMKRRPKEQLFHPVISSRVVHGEILFLCLPFSPPSFSRKHRAIYHTYTRECHMGGFVCTCACVCVCVHLRACQGPRRLVCSGVRSVIKLSTCITTLNHHPAPPVYSASRWALEQCARTHTQSGLTWPSDRIPVRIWQCILSQMNGE